MGTWGINVFDNDDALDWISLLSESTDVSLVRGTLQNVLSCSGKAGAPECCEALAAAEVVAASNGRPADDLPEEVAEFVNQTDTLELLALVDQAKEAVDRIAAESELRDLWAETENLGLWLEMLRKVKIRLQ